MPKGVYERKTSESGNGVAQNQPEEVKPKVVEEVKPPERKFSDDKDHKGMGHALCFTCEHRDDMHHVWKSYQVTKIVKDFLGNMHPIVEDMKDKVYDVKTRPCQHACKCEEYK